MKKVALILSLALVGLTGCSEMGDDMSSSTLVQVTTNAGEAPTITPPSGDAPTTLIIEDVIV